jgi:steroid delta-isomerase
MASSAYPAAMTPEVERLLDRHERVFNEAVARGDFAELVALFTADAVLRFEGVTVGPFTGREAIAAAYATHPPTAGFTVRSRTVGSDGVVVESVSWGEDASPSGELELRVGDGLIAELTVRFLAGA